jgi:hypothetical protein
MLGALTDLPKKYYDKEGVISMAGIGYTAALVVMGLGVVNMGWNMDFTLPTVAIIGGGSIATWGYLKASGVLY